MIHSDKEDHAGLSKLKKKILFCEAGVHGGSVMRLTSLLQNIDMDHFEPSLFTYFETGKAKTLINLSKNITIDTLGLTSFPAPDTIVKIGPVSVPTYFCLKYFFRSLIKLFSFRPDVIYLNNTPFCHLPMILAAKIFNVNVICHLRDTIFLTRSEKWALKNITGIVVLSESHNRFYKNQGVSPGKITVIYNGIDLTEFDKAAEMDIKLPDNSDNVITLAGVLSDRKRHQDALTALGLIVKDFPDAKLLLLGDGPERAKLEHIVKKEGLGANVIFQGMVPNVAPYLRRCKLGLMVSEREGMPNVILEYMAAGLPVVATDILGVSEIVQDGVTGYIIPVGDTKALALAIKKLLADEHQALYMGQAGRKILESGMFTLKTESASINHLLADV